MGILIKKMSKEDISEAAHIGEKCFSGLRPYQKALDWITSNFNASPRTTYYIAEELHPLGYLLWLEKGGFREKSVLELEQICVHPEHQGQGIGTKLIIESLKDMINYLNRRGSTLKLVEVTTGTENEAQKLYKKTMDAEIAATVPDLFRGDEVIMIARYENIVKKIDMKI
jgi:ribosomal protein S18 acetylase RimI-like enzyme